MIDKSYVLVITRGVECDYQILKTSEFKNENLFKDLLISCNSKEVQGWGNRDAGFVAIWGKGGRNDRDYRPISFLVAFKLSKENDNQDIESILKARGHVFKKCDSFFDNANNINELNSNFQDLANELNLANLDEAESASINNSDLHYWSDGVSKLDLQNLELFCHNRKSPINLESRYNNSTGTPKHPTTEQSPEPTEAIDISEVKRSPGISTVALAAVGMFAVGGFFFLDHVRRKIWHPGSGDSAPNSGDVNASTPNRSDIDANTSNGCDIDVNTKSRGDSDAIPPT